MLDGMCQGGCWTLKTQCNVSLTRSWALINMCFFCPSDDGIFMLIKNAMLKLRVQKSITNAKLECGPMPNVMAGNAVVWLTPNTGAVQ